MTISESIKDIRFKGLEKYDCSKIVGFLSEADKWNSKISLWHCILNILFFSFFDNRKYVIKETKGCQKNLFAYNDLHAIRADMYNMLQDVYNCSPDASFVELTKSIRIKNPKDIFSLIKLQFLWLSKLISVTGLGFSRIMAVVSAFVKTKTIIARLDKFKNYQNVIVCYDANFIDNVPAQFFKVKGGKSITLQHGVMCASKNVPYYGIWFRCFISDYFLAWNNLTREEAVKDGIPVNKVVVCGIAKCINTSKIVSPKNRIIGLLLDGYDFINVGIIKVANDFCRKYGYKYVLRYHPNYKGNEYDNIILSDYYVGNNRETLYEYARKVEFTLQGNSTALMELLYMGHPTYVFSTDNEVEIYPEFIRVSHNVKELEDLIKSESYLNDISDRLVSVKDIKKEYTSFFESL